MATTATIAYIGATSGTGFGIYSRLAAAAQDTEHVILLRSLDRFRKSPQYQTLSPGVLARTVFIEGDALDSESVIRLIERCGLGLQAVITTLGHTQPQKPLRVLAFGFEMSPPSLVSKGMVYLLQALRQKYDLYPTKPKVILQSSVGVGKESFADMSFLTRMTHAWLLKEVVADKIAAEVVLQKALTPGTTDDLPIATRAPRVSELDPSVLSPMEYDAVPASFISPTDAIVLRPNMLKDEPAKGWGNYQVAQDGDIASSSAWSLPAIGRGDVADFVAALLGFNDNARDAEKWWGHQVVLGYYL